jgi:hypothetical protein
MAADYSRVRAERKIVAFHDTEKISNSCRGSAAGY